MGSKNSGRPSTMPKDFDPDLSDQELVDMYGVSKRSIQRWRHSMRSTGTMLAHEERLEGQEIRWRNRWLQQPW